MAHQAELPLPGARLIVFASAELTDGFSLIGAEVHPDADPARVEEVLARLVNDGSTALVLLESRLSRPAGLWLSRLREQGGRIVVTELPPLAAPHDFAPAVDEVVRAVLGPEALA
jgi:vacuolar-type H+-ATPase subunit F/Vma7